MRLTRRDFLAGTAAALAGQAFVRGGVAASAPGRAGAGASYDPWLEVDARALADNASEVARLAGGRPILAVVKNDAYGLGLATVGPILDAAAPVVGLAVVRTDEAVALREAGVRKPILLMGLVSEREAVELVRRDVRLAPFGDGAAGLLDRLARRLAREIRVHLYLDTGMGRLGVPFRRAREWIEQVTRQPGVRVEGTFMTFTEEDDFDPVQLARFLDVARAARDHGVELGRLHAASSHGLFFRPEAYLDMVRPGLALYGAYPAGAGATGLAALQPAFRLRARVVRVERLEPGDSVSYGRSYVADRPVWVAALPVGHADGYPRSAVKGCQVLIGSRLFPVIGAVSASHTIVEVGTEPTVAVGDEATLVGPDDPAIHPNTVAERAEISVYDVLMHLGGRLPRRVAG